MHHYMYLCQPEFRILVHPLCIVIWNHGFPGVAQCVCSSQSTFGPTHCLEWVCVEEDVGPDEGWLETLTWGHSGAHILAATMWRVGADLGCQVDMPACADACTHYNQGAENRWAMTGICRWGNTGMDRFEHNYVKGLGRIALVSLSNK